jgi:drug/metabolite transporter (DMT)-like permease
VKKTIGVLIPAVLAQGAGNVFLSMRMKEVGSCNWLDLLPRAIESPTLWFGTALLVVSFLLFAAALSWADLSFVVPAVSVEVVVNVLLASYVLHEVVSPMRWAGVLFISIGVLLVIQSERKKGRKQREDLHRGEQ